MKTKLLIATTAVAALGSGAAFAQCDQRIQSLSGEYGDFFVAGNAGFTEGRLVLRNLRDAAFRLQQQGLEDACEQVVDAMDSAVQAYQAAGTTGAPASTTTGGTMSGTTTTGTATTGAMTTTAVVPARGEMTPEQIQARVVPVAETDFPLNTEQMQGRDVYNFNLEDVGDFEGVLISGGEPTHIIVSHGGFLNLGDNEVAIPIENAQYDAEWRTFFVPFTEQQIEDAPEYERTADWDQTLTDDYWGRG